MNFKNKRNVKKYLYLPKPNSIHANKNKMNTNNSNPGNGYYSGGGDGIGGGGDGTLPEITDKDKFIVGHPELGMFKSTSAWVL